MSSLQQLDSSYARINSGGGKVFSDNVAYHIENLEINNHPQPEPQRQPNPRCPPASDNFVGRMLELEQMWTFFFGPGVRFDQRRVLLLIGMGGCGKTQLARKFMTRVYHKFQSRTHLVFYLDATTEQTLKASLTAIAKANGVGESSEEALSWMSNLDKEMFLYFDNADDPAINLRKYFPNSDHARILITTRLHDAQRNYGSGRGSAIHLRPLSEEEARDLLYRTVAVDRDDSEQEIVSSLIQELHCLPLAVVQAGAAIFKAKWTFAEYLGRFRRLRTSLMDGKQDRVESKAIDDYPWHVHTTWRLSYDRLSESTAKLLQLCAHLHHTGITEDLFQYAFDGLKHGVIGNPPVPFVEGELAARAFLESFSIDDAWDETGFRWCIQEACSFSLLSYDTANHSYSIHPLIHDCLQSIPSNLSQTTFLFAASTQPTWRDQIRLLSLVPHAQRLLDCHSPHSGQVTALHPTLAQSLGQCFWAAEMHSSAQQMYETALRGLAEHCLSDHPMVLLLQNDLGLALSGMGHYGKAEKLLQEVLAKEQATLGLDHPETITTMSNVAATLARHGRLEEAAEMQRDILEKRRAILGPNHPDTVRALANLSSIIYYLGSYQEAEVLDREVLQRRRAILGANHPDTVHAFANLATTLYSLGHYHEAEAMKREVLEKTQATLGANHPETIRALANLATALYSLGFYQEVEGMDREVLERRRAILGPNHPASCHALTTLAVTIYIQGRYAEAEPMLRQAVGGFTHVLGPNHPDTTWVQDALEECIIALQEHWVKPPMRPGPPADPPVHPEHISTPPEPAYCASAPTSPEASLSPPTTAEAATRCPAKPFGKLSKALKKVARSVMSCTMNVR